MLLPGIYGRETRAEEKGTETILTEGTSKQNIYVQNLPALPAEFLRSEIRVIIYLPFNGRNFVSFKNYRFLRLFEINLRSKEMKRKKEKMKKQYKGAIECVVRVAQLQGSYYHTRSKVARRREENFKNDYLD